MSPETPLFEMKPDPALQGGMGVPPVNQNPARECGGSNPTTSVVGSDSKAPNQPRPRRVWRTLTLMLITHAIAAAIGAGLLFHYQPRWLVEMLYPRPRTAIELDPLLTAPSMYH